MSTSYKPHCHPQSLLTKTIDHRQRTQRPDPGFTVDSISVSLLHNPPNHPTAQHVVVRIAPTHHDIRYDIDDVIERSRGLGNAPDRSISLHSSQRKENGSTGRKDDK